MVAKTRTTKKKASRTKETYPEFETPVVFVPPKKGKKTEDLHIRVSSELKRQIVAAAAEDRRNISNWVENALWLLLKKVS